MAFIGQTSRAFNLAVPPFEKTWTPRLSGRGGMPAPLVSGGIAQGFLKLVVVRFEDLHEAGHGIEQQQATLTPPHT
jgi:hypothetical protein